MTSITETPLSNSAKFVAVAFALVGAIRMADFIFYGQELRDVLAGVGFGLMSYGIYKNGFVTEARNTGGRYASLAGAILLIASVLVRFGA